MGNVLNAKPQHYSADQTKSRVYSPWSYMATYKQNDPNADHMAYGTTNLQFGVKLIQDVDSGPRQGDMYVIQANTGKRLYFTHKGQVAPYAQEMIRQGVGFGNGPAVAITGSPLNPKYSMFYSKGGDEHGASNDWTPYPINNKQDIINAMTAHNGVEHTSTKGRYANYYGDASINPFGVKEGRDMWTEGAMFGTSVAHIIGAVALPVAETALDDVIPFGSQILQVSGVNKVLQQGINALGGANKGAVALGTSSQLDPTMSNMIQDPRLGSYLANIQNQSQQFIAKYGSADYSDAEKMAQATPMQEMQKAKLLAQENQNLYTRGQVQEMQDAVAKLKQVLPAGKGADIFANIETGLRMASNNSSKLNIISHFSDQIKSQLLPLLQTGGDSPTTATGSGGQTPPDMNPHTASAQVNHPTLSINGTDSRPPHGNMALSSFAAAGAAGAVP